VSGTTPRVVIADDDVLLREGLASLLERSGFDVVAQAGDAPALLAMVRERHPDLTIVDIRMPPDNVTAGLDAALVIRKEFPETGILVLSAHAELEDAMELLATGGHVGYLLKSRVTDVEEFADTARRIARGSSVVDPALVQELIGGRHRSELWQQLTPRERSVLALMAEGRSNAGIARRLWITEGTVEKHVRHILSGIGVPDTGDDNRRVLAVLAYLESRLTVRHRHDAADRWPRQIRLRQERQRGTVHDQVRELVRRIRRDQDHPRVSGPCAGRELHGEVESALLAEFDVDQDDVRPELTGETAGVRRR
jgi:DNA-binding NarL/FixJ family response regulator